MRRPKRKQPVGRRPRSERGTATVEAVIALPVFILLFVGVTYFGRLAIAKVDADAAARRCAWLYSMNNCEQAPPGCSEPTRAPPNPSNALSQAVEHGKEALAKGDLSALVAPIITSILGRALDEATGSSRIAHASRTVSRPKMFGGDVMTKVGDYRLACNLVPQAAPDIAEKVWKVFRP